MKIYIIVILLIIANFQWIFILSNFDRINSLKDIKSEIVNKKAVDVYKNDIENEGYLYVNTILDVFNKQNPINISIPSINIESPIYTSS
jgi:sortase (surface protein transpeptidase)